jgi:hypothetical protein
VTRQPNRAAIRRARPTATDLEDVVPGSRREPLENAPVLRRLGGRKRLHRVALEERARVGHRPVQPERIEVVAEIVVRGDVAPAAAAGIGVERVPETVGELAPEPAIDRALDGGAVARDHRQQLREVGRGPPAVDERLGEPDVAAPQRRAERPSPRPPAAPPARRAASARKHRQAAARPDRAIRSKQRAPRGRQRNAARNGGAARGRSPGDLSGSTGFEGRHALGPELAPANGYGNDPDRHQDAQNAPSSARAE